jgi:hypothetical protein
LPFTKFQTYNLKFHNSIAIIENGSLLIGYGKDLNKITNSLSEININQYTSKNLMRYKNNENNFIICNITNNKYLILTEEKTSTTLDSTVINLILDYLIKLLKEE